MADAATHVPAEAAAAATPAAPAQESPKGEDSSLKVFAGNISFQTTEDDLKRIFSEAGTVTSASVITRGTRHLGYGFVTFATAEEAQKAIATLHDKEISGRKMAVEAVKPESAGARKASGEKRAPKTTARRPRIDEGEEESGPAAAEGVEKPKGAAKPRKPRGKKPNGAGVTDGLGTPAAGAAPDVNGAAGGAGAGAGAAATNGLGTPAAGRPPRAPRAAGDRPPRAPRGPKGPPEGPPSQTLLFVANLPFEVTTEEHLREIFPGTQIRTATVAKHPYGKRSKGYAFVDFVDHENQQKALKEFNGKEVQGREITVKVANEDVNRKKREEEKDEAAKEAAAAAPAAAADAAAPAAPAAETTA